MPADPTKKYMVQGPEKQVVVRIFKTTPQHHIEINNDPTLLRHERIRGLKLRFRLASAWGLVQRSLGCCVACHVFSLAPFPLNPKDLSFGAWGLGFRIQSSFRAETLDDTQ